MAEAYAKHLTYRNVVEIFSHYSKTPDAQCWMSSMSRREAWEALRVAYGPRLDMVVTEGIRALRTSDGRQSSLLKIPKEYLGKCVGITQVGDII